jgi:hypothetical protein
MIKATLVLGALVIAGCCECEPIRDAAFDPALGHYDDKNVFHPKTTVGVEINGKIQQMPVLP